MTEILDFIEEQYFAGAEELDLSEVQIVIIDGAACVVIDGIHTNYQIYCGDS